ncbi:MAG TPA: hypothetical protein VNE39_21310 [Planctomycetota bacterium]|nr:hypothetical protein [Planctomycetota bacterium]
MLSRALVPVVVLVVVVESGELSFTSKPTVRRAGNRVAIEFAVDRATDVAVYVEDPSGKVLRHLAAGVLGPNAPEPLSKDSLKQTLMWDGTDDLGNAVAPGPVRVRVCAGMQVRYGGVAFAKEAGPNAIVDVTGLAVRPDGRLYALGNRWSRYSWQNTAVSIYRRDGSYEKTIKPFPPSLAPERVAALGAFKSDKGDLIPIIHRVLGTTFYPYEDRSGQQMAVTRDGMLVVAAVAPGLNAVTRGESAHLAAIDADGGIPLPSYAGPLLREKHGFDRVHLVMGSDDKTVYLTGIGPRRHVSNVGTMAFNAPAVFRATLPALGPAEPVFGDPAAAGNDDAHLDDPRGIACDGKAHLFVADFANNRVVVLDEKEMKLVAAVEVEAPEWVGVNPRTGELYVQSNDQVVKFSGWREPKQVAAASLAWAQEGLKGEDKKRLRLFFALDAGAERPVLWVGRSRGADPLRRCEDLRDEFSDFTPAGCYNAPYLWNLSVDPTRQDVACRVGDGSLEIVNEATGSTERIRADHATVCRLGPKGEVYGMHHWGKTGIVRYDRKGKTLPFEATANDPDRERQGRLRNRPSGTTSWERDFFIDRRGDIYVKNRGEVYHGLMTVEVYGPDGAHKRTAIWLTCDGSLGPRVDPRGNLYMGECIKPIGKPYPDLFAGRLPKHAEREYTWMYGSLVKYSPEGGAAWFPYDYDYNTRKQFPYPFEGEAKLDPNLPREKVSGNRGPHLTKEPFDLQGALWWRFGFAYLLDMSHCGTDRCHCTACDFDVDDFGRVFYPDQGRFRVEVIDTNGNEILHFGAYGNQDYCGPSSYVVDPKTRLLRPRQPDDAADIESPFAKPEIAFNWFVGLAVSDRFVYVADGANRRVLRCKIGYAAQETSDARSSQ